MTQDEIIEMARQVDFEIENGMFDSKLVCVDGVDITKGLEAFAKLVAAKERERIANKVDELGDGDPVYTWWVAEQIRARGET